MKRVIASIHLKQTAEGGRAQSLPAPTFGCPVFFEGVPELGSHGYDCRLLVQEYGKAIGPGDTAEGMPVVFLSAEEVMPKMKPGVQFALWEGKIIGHGTVLRIEEAD